MYGSHMTEKMIITMFTKGQFIHVQVKDNL